MNNALITFNFNTLSVLVLDHADQPWFMVKDDCNVLGIKNVTDATRKITDDRNLRLNLGLPGRAPLIVNEAGLYELILQPRKPEAREFKRWVTGTVLPAIHKDGTHVMGVEKVASYRNPSSPSLRGWGRHRRSP